MTSQGYLQLLVCTVRLLMLSDKLAFHPQSQDGPVDVASFRSEDTGAAVYNLVRPFTCSLWYYIAVVCWYWSLRRCAHAVQCGCELRDRPFCGAPRWEF